MGSLSEKPKNEVKDRIHVTTKYNSTYKQMNQILKCKQGDISSKKWEMEVNYNQIK